MSIRLTTALLIVLLASAASLGQTPLGSAFTYQGQLKQSGVPLTGTVDLDCSLWDADTAGNQAGATLNLPSVYVTNGLFTIQLDFGAGIFDGGARWLEITVNGTTLSPRQECTATPYALHAARPWESSAGNISFATGNVGVGTGDPQARLHLAGGPTWTNNGWTKSLAINSAEALELGYGASTTRYGIGSSQNGLYFFRTATEDADAAANYFLVADASGRVGIGTTTPTTTLDVAGPIKGVSDIVNGAAVYGEGTDAANGGQFVTSYEYGVGVVGYATATTGGASGVLGRSDSPYGVGVRGWANAASGINVGVYGTTGSESGIGVEGVAVQGFGATRGVYGLAYSDAGDGVYGLVEYGTGNAGVHGVSGAMNGNGVIAGAQNGSSAYGLWAVAPQGIGVHCEGALTVTGTKSLRIDHPFDPENKFLLHYCAEGPEPLNMYTGNVTTDGRGFADIALPAYFEEINKDFRYQLTVTDESDEFVLAKVVRGVHENSFRIRTSKPGVQVSWMVLGTRNDRYVRRYGAPVEPEKSVKEKGSYQHPELYGQPPEKAQSYRYEHERSSLPAVPDATPR